MMPEWCDFFLRQLSLIAVVLVLHTYIGLHIIRRTLIFSDLALDQLAAFGALVALAAGGVELNTPFSYAASLAAVLSGAFVLAVVKSRSDTVPREAVIGITYALALIATIMLTDRMDAGAMYFNSVLEGNVDWVSWPLIGITGGVYLALLLFHCLFRKRFIALVEQPSGMKRTWWWDFLFFGTQGVITVLIVPVAGVFLAYVFLMLPAASALMFTYNWMKALALGWGIGFVACCSGLTLSYNTNWPYSPTLVLSMGAFFLAAIVIRIAMKRKEAGRRSERTGGHAVDGGSV